MYVIPEMFNIQNNIRYSCIIHVIPGGGFFKKIRTGMLKLEFKISTISIPRKAWFCDPSLYHFSAKSTQFGANWVLFLANFSKIHPILQIGRIRYATITHPSIYQNLRKCTSKPLSIPVYHFVSENPPGGVSQLNLLFYVFTQSPI